MHTFLKNIIVAALATGLMVACGTEDEAGPESSLTPRLQGLLETDLVVGQTVYVAGENFLSQTEGHTELVFEGYFQPESGQPQHTTFVTTPLYDGYLAGDENYGDVLLEAGTDLLRLSRFGPFQVPFTGDGNQLGTFKGTLTARNVLTDGTVRDSDPVDVTINVRPSIIIRRLEPFVGFEADGITPLDTGCGTPALRALHNLPYILEVEAVGFAPAYWNFEFTGVNGKNGELVSYGMEAVGQTSEVGSPKSGKMLVFNQVEDDAMFFYATIRINATIQGSSGDFVETALPISVHRPLEFRMADATSKVAQFYEPIPVTGCIPGTLAGHSTYAETKTEARQKAVSVSVSKSWTQSTVVSDIINWSEGISHTDSNSTAVGESWSHSESETASETYGVSYNHSDSNSVDFSSTEGEGWSYDYNKGTSQAEMEQKMGELFGQVSSSVNVEVSGEGSVPGFAKVGGKVGTTVGATVGGKTGQTVGQTVGSTTSEGSGMNGSKSESQGFGSTTTDSAGETMSDSYALTSQDQVGKQTNVTEASSDSKVYTVGGSGGISEGLSVGEQKTWAETWSTTESDTTLLSYSGLLPYGRYGTWYRQTVRYVRTAQVYSYDLCGVKTLMGNLNFSEFAWSPALAIDDSCDDGIIPVSDLPPADCFVPPCS